MVETGSALLVVVALLVVLRSVLGRTGWLQAGAGSGLRVVAVRGLTGRAQLCVVEVDGRRLLVGVSDGGVSLIDRLEPEEDAEQVELPESDSAGGLRKGPTRWLRLLLVAGVLLASPMIPTLASAAEPATLSIDLNGLSEPDEISSSLEIVAVLTLVSVAPSILLMMTCFTRVVIVLAFLRQAIGVQQLPPSQVLVGLALFITFFVMAPVAEQIRVDAYQPYVEKEIDAETAAERAVTPVREFLLQHTREADLALFADLTTSPAPADPVSMPFTSLLPAFMLSELRTAFEIGFMIYLPFLVVDLIIASMLISMGMIVLPPIVISLPFKLMLFVLMDGWNRVVGSLIGSLG